VKNPESKAKTARNVLKSWAKATGIPTYEMEGADVAFMTPSGIFGVKIGTGTKENVVYLKPDEIANQSNRSSVETFEAVLEMLNIRPTHNFYRGSKEDLDHRTYGGRTLSDGTSELDYTMFRHLEFRTAPNLSSSEMDKYKGCIKASAARFYKMNYHRLNRLCIDLEDLEQYAKVWTTNFIHRYRREDDHEATCALLLRYLKQRFVEYNKLITRHETDMQPSVGVLDAYTYSDQNLSTSYEGEDDGFTKIQTWTVQPDVFRFQELADREEGEARPEPAYRTRVRHAQQRLRKAVVSMPREKVIELLSNAAGNDFIAEDAQDLARKLLAELTGEGVVQENA
jgi:hypothetical protein